MNELLPFGERCMTVREVAEALGCQPDTIQKIAKRLESEGKIARISIRADSSHALLLDETQVQAVKEALVPRDLASKSKVEAATTRLEMVAKAAEVISWLSAERERLCAEVAALAPDAGAARIIALADGLKTFNEVDKINGVGPRKIIELLIDRRILYRQGRSILPYQEHIEAGRFVVKERTVEISGADHLYSQTLITGKGEVWIAKQLFPLEAKS